MPQSDQSTFRDPDGGLSESTVRDAVSAITRYGRDVQVGAETLRRLRKPEVGADLRARGKYAVYFYDEKGEQIRSVGGFSSPADAAKGVYLIWAETVLEEVELDRADNRDWHDA